MESKAYSRGHAVCVTGPFQSHIKAMLKFAKLLRHKGFHITFVNTEFIHDRLQKAEGYKYSLDGLPNFRFEAIPDGLPPPNGKKPSQDPKPLLDTIRNNVLLHPFLDLLSKRHDPPISCIVSDAFMSFTVTAAKKFGLPIVLFNPITASSFMECHQFYTLRSKGLIQFQDESCLKEEYLETVVEGIPGMKDICMRDLLSYIRSIHPDISFFDFTMKPFEELSKASTIVIHTFDALEQQVLDDLSSKFPNLFAIGRLQLLLNQIEEEDSQLKSIGYSLWKEETECLEWLDSKQPKSVIYVNFGSGAVITREQFIELAMGLANSDQQFLWIIREDLVLGGTTDLPNEFEVKLADTGKGFIASWCPQDDVLDHPSIGGFLTHCGWGSTIESLSAGIEIKGEEDEQVKKRNEVEKFVRELMDGGEKCKELRKNAAEWRRLGEEAAAAPNGSSYKNFEKLVNEVLTRKQN
ncbi:Glycosyltransferase [Melia azedarach]|uniref:Glycosyltransferase n=1 Tax=Melia azedarach TaxID=155640 RepID=A0ACC1X4X6_MELAZ|nr:Glycosyltransferase [Melia azedarach]